jgi:hypothetical protein
MIMSSLSKYRIPCFAPEGVGGGGAPGSSPSPATSAPASAPSGAPSSSPAPSPTSSSPSASPGSASEGGAGESFDFGSMFEPVSDPVSALADTGAPPAAPKAESPTPPQEVPPTAPVEAPPIASEGTQPKAEAAKAAPDQSTSPAAAAQPSPYIDPYDPAILSQHLAQNEAQAVELVAQQMFQLSPEEKEALEQDVIGTVPKLLAKVFVKQQQNALTQMGRMIPMMIQRHLQAVKRNDGNEGKFYQRWPDIDREKHHDSVVKYASVYRQMHPQASLEQMIEDLGPMVMMANKIVPQSLRPAAPAAAARQSGTPATSANGRGPPSTPFVPAGTGAAQAPRTPELEAWEAMFREPPS